MKFRVLVCGGRDYSKEWKVFSALRNLLKLHPEGLVVIEGGARGADKAARTWAEAFEKCGHPIEHLQFAAEWPQYGTAAGSIRNAEMLREGCPDLVVAFPGGRGTRDMVTQARRAGVEVVYGEEIANET